MEKNKMIPIEVGYGSKGFKQVLNTMGKIKCAYGLSVANSPLSLNKTGNAVTVSLPIFLLA